MKKIYLYIAVATGSMSAGCQQPVGPSEGFGGAAASPAAQDTLMQPPVDSTVNPPVARKTLPYTGAVVSTGNVQPASLVAFAQSLTGTPYHYGGTQPESGFDCSGFITYVFNHFGIAVPRSSIEFTNVGKTIPLDQSRTGDLILFTGTDPQATAVGHMGIVVSNSDTLRFVHSTSGKQYGVTTSPFSPSYQRRFVRIARVFPE